VWTPCGVYATLFAGEAFVLNAEGGARSREVAAKRGEVSISAEKQPRKGR